MGGQGDVLEMLPCGENRCCRDRELSYDIPQKRCKRLFFNRHRSRFVAIIEDIGFSPFAVIYVEEGNICYLKNKKEAYHT